MSHLERQTLDGLRKFVQHQQGHQQDDDRYENHSGQRRPNGATVQVPVNRANAEHARGDGCNRSKPFDTVYDTTGDR